VDLRSFSSSALSCASIFGFGGFGLKNLLVDLIFLVETLEMVRSIVFTSWNDFWICNDYDMEFGLRRVYGLWDNQLTTKWITLTTQYGLLLVREWTSELKWIFLVL